MRTLTTSQIRKFALLLVLCFLSVFDAEELIAQFIRGGGRARADVRGTSRRTARRVNRRHDAFYGGRGYYGGGGYYAAPAAAAVAAAAVLTSLPGGCSPYNNYYNCGGTYYEPTMQGTEVVYVEVKVDDD